MLRAAPGGSGDHVGGNMHRRDGSWSSRFVFSRARALEARITELEGLVASARAAACAADERVDAVPLPLVYLTPELAIERVSPTAERFFGQPRSALVGRCFLDGVVARGARDRAKAYYRELFAAPLEPRELVLPLETDRGAREARLRHAVVRDDAGAVRVVACTLDDPPRAGDAASDGLESVRRLAGGIAHDLNNRLAVILGVLELALPVTRGDARLHRDLADAFSAAQRAALLTGELMAFGRHPIAQPEPLRLGELASDLREAIARLVGDAVTLELAHDPGAPVVLADRRHLEQVLMSLAANARDAMPGGGRLTIRTLAGRLDGPRAARLRTRECACAVLEVADTGSGMDDATLARIFEPFFTTKTLDGGVGLGLAAASRIVEQAGGCIDVESRLGAGSTFRIHLPAAERHAEAAAPVGG